MSNTFIGNNGQGTSQITFKGTEDLGGGLKASFLLENDFNARYDARGNEGTTSAAVNGTNFGTSGGEQFLGLEGGFGSVKVGAPNTPSLTAQAARQPFSTKIGGGFNGVLGTGHVRSNNSIVYATPVFSGFSAAVAYGFKHNAVAIPSTGTAAQQANTNTGATSSNSTVAANQTSISDIGVNYANGPFAAGASFWNTAAVTSVAGVTTPSTKQTNLYASYDFGVAKVMGGYHTEKQDAVTALRSAAGYNAAGTAITGQATSNYALSGADARGWNLAASVPVNANLSLLANYGKLNDKLTARAANPLDKSIAAIGLRYNLSKNTSLYARYVAEKNENVAAALAAGSAGSLAAPNQVSGATDNNAAKITTTVFGMQTNF